MQERAVSLQLWMLLQQVGLHSSLHNRPLADVGYFAAYLSVHSYHYVPKILLSALAQAICRAV